MEKFKYLIAILVLLNCSACSLVSFPESHEEQQQANYLVHTVKYEGETYAIMSLWYTGKMSNWKSIREVNPSVDVLRIALGSSIRIPEELLKRSAPYSKSELANLLNAIQPKATQTTKTEVPGRSEATLEPKIRPAVSVSSEPTDSFYPVTSISGCETFGNSEEGLAGCADLIDTLIEIH